MSSNTDPTIGSWYEHLERGQKFEVLDVDEDRGVVEVQYTDGDIDEMDIDEWHELELEPIDTPEDWVETEEEQDATDAGAASEAEPWIPRSKRLKTAWEDEDEDGNEEEEPEEDGDWGQV